MISNAKRLLERSLDVMKREVKPDYTLELRQEIEGFLSEVSEVEFVKGGKRACLYCRRQGVVGRNPLGVWIASTNREIKRPTPTTPIILPRGIKRVNQWKKCFPLHKKAQEQRWLPVKDTE